MISRSSVSFGSEQLGVKEPIQRGRPMTIIIMMFEFLFLIFGLIFSWVI